jgi:hypothetical protein
MLVMDCVPTCSTLVATPSRSFAALVLVPIRSLAVAEVMVAMSFGDI